MQRGRTWWTREGVEMKKGTRRAGALSTWSDKRDSNPRPRPWQGRALPTELLSPVAGPTVRTRKRCKDKAVFGICKVLPRFFREK